MQTSHSAHTAFDKRRIRFSDWVMQYAIVFVLLFAGLLFGSYYFLNQQQAMNVKLVHQLNDVALSSYEIELGWQSLVVDRKQSSRDEISNLILREAELAQRLKDLLPTLDNLPYAPVTISRYSLEEQAQLASSRLSQVRAVARERSSHLDAGMMISTPMLTAFSAAFLLLMGYLIWGWRRVLSDRREAIQFFHAQIDKAQVGNKIPVPVVRNDEFGEFARYLNAYIHLSQTERREGDRLGQIYKLALSESLSHKLVLNSSNEVIATSAGFSELWVLEPATLSEILGVDEYLSSLDGEVISDAFIGSQESSPILLGKDAYEVRGSEITLDGEVVGFLLELTKVVPRTELKILEASLSLMAQDVWDAPIRILDDASPYYSFSGKLEKIRQDVAAFLDAASQLVQDDDKQYLKVTKLQQLLEWLNANLKSTSIESDTVEIYQQKLRSDVENSKNDFLKVREQIEYRFELYEAYLQQLLEWQAAQGTWVATVNGGLQDTKEAVLNLLSIVHTESTDVSVVEHSVIDLAHDIDTVLVSIVESKPLPKELRLEHIKSSESDLMRHLNHVQTKLDLLSSTINEGLPLTHKSL